MTSENHGTFYYHYAWVIVAIIAGFQMVGSSVRMAFGVFIDPLSQDFGWSQGSITLAYGISSVVSAVASPWAGQFGDRYGARRTMTLGSCLFIIGMILTGLITELWHFYLAFGVLLGISQALFLVPMIPAAMVWFRRHLGVGMGFIMTGWGIGPAIVAPLMGFLIVRLGWEWTFWSSAAISAVIMSIMIYFFKDRPIDRGVLPYGAHPDDPLEQLQPSDPQQVKLFSKYMNRTMACWNMSSIHFFGCVGHAVILVYLIPIAVQEGLSLLMAASMLTIVSTVSIATRLGAPILADHYDTKIVMAIFYFIQGITVVMLFWTHSLWAFSLFGVIFGVGYGGEAGIFPILNRKYYGQAPMGSAYGLQMLGAGLGMALGGWIGGIIFDITHSYDLALIVSIATSLIGAISILLLKPTDKLLIPDWEEKTKLS